MRKVLLIAVFVLIILFNSFPYEFKLGIVKYRGGDWYNNIEGVKNLLSEVSKRTTMKIRLDPGIVDLSSREIFEYDFLYISGHTPIYFSDREIKNLREYILLNNGFVFVNDDYGMDESFRKEIKRVFPENELQLVPYDHPIYRGFYKFSNGLPKIHEHDGGSPEGWGIFINGELRLFYAYNTDIGDGWDKPEVHNNPPEVIESAIRMGINIIVYSITRSVVY
ncbi:MAG: DUF4159 domain-containing protein [Brevinematales bacterium]|nr:DUF4159 domain-containing protein [Brevinematales bacterium]